MDTFKEKFINFVKVKKDYLISFGILFVSFFVMLLLNWAFPFSDRSLLVSDSHVQIGAFFRHVIDVFSGKVNFFYTNQLGGGVEIASTIEYMLLSPFYLIAFLGGKNNYMGWFNFSIFAMLVFVNFVFLWFSKKYFKNITSLIRIILSLFFTYSAYICLNFGFVTWLIYPALLLLIIDAFMKLVYQEKVLSFSLLMVWYVVNSFSLGVFTNIILVFLFSIYIIIHFEKNERGKIFLRLLIAYIIAVLLSVIVLFPAVTAMLSSSRMSTSIQGLMQIKTTILAQKAIALLMDNVVLVLAVIYFIKTGKKSKFNKFMLIAIGALLMPIIFDTVMKFLNGGSYFGFPSRNYFILEALLFITVLNMFDKKVLEFQESKTSLPAKVLFWFMASLMVVGIVCLEVFFFEELGVSLKNPVITVKTTLYMLLIFVMVALLIAMIVLSNKRKLFSQKMAKASLLFVMIFSVSINYLSFAGGTYIDETKLKEAKTLITENNVKGKLKNFNIEFGEALITNNLDMGISPSSYFSSLVSNQTLESMRSIGFVGSATGYTGSTGSLVTDSLYGHTYFISEFEENRPYLTLVDSSENYYLYKNELATTGVLLLDDGFKFDDKASYLENMESLKQLLNVNGTLFETPTVSTEIEKDMAIEENVVITKHTFTANSTGILYVDAETEFENYNDYLICSEYYETEEVFFIKKDSISGYYSDISYLEAGETITFYLVHTAATIDKETIKFQFMNYSVAEEMCLKLQEKDVEINYTKNGWNVSGTANEKCQLVVLSPDIDGMNYTYNSKSVKSTHSIGQFATFDIEAGDFEVKAKYEYRYSKIWIIYAVCAVALVCAIYFSYKKWGFAKLKKLTYISFLVVCAVIVAIVYVLGTIWSFCLILA